MSVSRAEGLSAPLCRHVQVHEQGAVAPRQGEPQVQVRARDARRDARPRVVKSDPDFASGHVRRDASSPRVLRPDAPPDSRPERISRIAESTWISPSSAAFPERWSTRCSRWCVVAPPPSPRQFSSPRPHDTTTARTPPVVRRGVADASPDPSSPLSFSPPARSLAARRSNSPARLPWSLASRVGPPARPALECSSW